MRVVLWPDVFADTRTLELMVFLWLGASMRHRVMVEDEDDDAYKQWLQGLNDATRADWERAVMDGLQQGETSPSYYNIQVTTQGSSTWKLPSPTLTIEDAIDLLQRPYRVLVENGYSDAAFLLCMCDHETREFFEERVRHEWVEMEHCGGNTHLKKRAKEARRLQSTQMRCSALFDGDGLRPGEPSSTSKSIKDLCSPDLHCHQLERRAIENYLPKVALEKWSKQTQGKAREIRQSQVEALFSMSDAARAHYNMKEGFLGDAPNAHKAGDLFDDISAETRRLLDNGLDRDIAKLYLDGYVHSADLEGAPAVDKVRVFAREIAERIR